MTGSMQRETKSPTTPLRADRLAASIRVGATDGGPALVGFVTAGYPNRQALVPTLRALGEHCAAIEIGVPFSDPMADGVTIQESSRAALAGGASLDWLLRSLEALDPSERDRLPPLALMGYLNPFVAMGFGLGADQLPARCDRAGIAALIIPDLPLEEAGEVRQALRRSGTGLVQLVSPTTPVTRAVELAKLSDGFLYVVTSNGVTGGGTAGAVGVSAELRERLELLRGVRRDLPVCAGFGISETSHVRALRGLCDGAIVGSAIIRCLGEGRDLGQFLQGLRQGGRA